MLRILLKHSFFYIVIILFALPIQAKSEMPDTVNKILIVGVAGSEPFVFEDNNKGIAVDIWEKIAEKESWEFKYIPYENVNDALHHLENGELDIVVGPISITSQRLENMRFSQPFYNSSISIISRVDNLNFWQTIKPLLSLKLAIAVLIYSIILGIVGTLFWLAEHKRSPEQFSSKPLQGIGSGMWLAIVTMSTTGYGDKAPITLVGRIIAGVWMVLSIIFATSMVAGIASTLTVTSLGTTTISTIEQLSGRKAATVSVSPADVFLKKSNIKVVNENNLNEAIEKLKNKDVDAVVYDRPQLLYYLKHNNDEDLFISKAEYYKQGYGFAFPSNSELTLDVNRSLLELAENQELNRIIHYYIQKDE